MLNEIDNDKYELDQFISKEEEVFTQKFGDKLDKAENEIQQRDGDYG